MVPILDASVEATYRASDVQTVKEGVPGNLLLVRGLTESEPGNEDLRSLATQMYFSYTAAFVEDEDPARARTLYDEGYRLGREGLMRRDWFREAEEAVPLPDSAALRKMKKDDAPLLIWTIANWASWISLNVSDPEAVAQLPRLQAYLDRVLQVSPDYFEGLPHALAGSMNSIRPRMFGGDPEAGQRHFEEAFRISRGRMLLYRVFHARYYCRQMLDVECFDQSLREVLDAPDDLAPEYRLLNNVAREKARRLMEKRDELF